MLSRFLLIILLQGITLGATINTIQYDKNKVPVVYEKFNALPIFNLQLVFKNSGYIIDGEKYGITNLTAHLLNEGTKKDGSVKFARKLESKAISIHSENGFETFVIEVSCLKSEYKEALRLLDKLLSNPNTSNKTIDKLKLMQISKIKQKEDDFDNLASKQLKSILFKDTPLAHSNSGEIKTINNITKKDIKKHLEQILNINNLIVVVGGDIEYDTIANDIKPILKRLSLAPTTTNNHKVNVNNKPTNTTLNKQTQQAYIYFGSPFNINFDDKDTYKAKVASFILGGSGFGSRLMEEIRVKQGLAYSAYGNIINHKSRSYFTGYLQTKLENTNKAKELVQTIVDEFIKNGVTKKELDDAKKFLLGSEPLRTETFSQRQNRAFNLYYQGFPLDYLSLELELINNLKLEDLNNYIKSHKEISLLSYSIITNNKQKNKGK